MTVLFLDIDGVMNDDEWIGSDERRERIDRWAREHGCSRWEAMAAQPAMDIRPHLAARVRRIVEATGCTVILCSSWRHHHTEATMRDLLGSHGIPLHGVVPELPTPKMSDYISLATERTRAILAHVATLAPGTRWVVLDDQVGNPWAVEHGGRAVPPDDGVTEADADAVIALLRGEA